jgi:hypothetical protein
LGSVALGVRLSLSGKTNLTPARSEFPFVLLASINDINRLYY